MNERDTEIASVVYGSQWTMQDMEFADLIRADEREKVLAGERIRIGTRLDTLKTAIELLRSENYELKDELKVRGNT